MQLDDIKCGKEFVRIGRFLIWKEKTETARLKKREKRREEKEKNLEMLINHLEYIAEKIGLDKVGFGFDFAEYYSTPDDEDEGLEGIHDVTEIPNVKKALEKRGYSKEEIENISYKNFSHALNPERKGQCVRVSFFSLTFNGAYIKRLPRRLNKKRLKF